LIEDIIELNLLGRKRQQTQWSGYYNIGDFHNGLYDSEDVSPYNRGAGNNLSEIMVVLQDWASADWLNRPFDIELARWGYKPGLPTNRHLATLLQHHFDLILRDAYVTNIFPFVKPGRMSARIPARDLRAAAEMFTLPEIQIVQPRLVIALGLPAFNTLRSVTGFRRVKTVAEAIDQPFIHGDTQIWCQAHTGGLGRANRNRGGVDRVNADWARMAAHYHEAGDAQ